MVKQPEDITYIASNLIGTMALRFSHLLAMGFPGNPKTRKVETQINKCDVTAMYLETKHPNHYMLFNLAEETYDAFLFHDQVCVAMSTMNFIRVGFEL